MVRSVISYFLLLRPVLGGGRGVVAAAVLFVGVFAGAVAHWIATSISADTVAWNWKELVLGLIAPASWSIRCCGPKRASRNRTT